MRRAGLLIGLLVACCAPSAHAATLDVPGQGPLALAGDQVLYVGPAISAVSTTLPGGVTAPTGPFSVASSTWIGVAQNQSRVCCKAADSIPLAASVDVRRADGSDPRTGATRTLTLPPTTDIPAVVAPALSPTQLALAYYRPGTIGTYVRVIDVATGAIVRDVEAPGLGAMTILDDGTLVLAPVNGCPFAPTVVAPDGTRTSAGPACSAPVGAGGRFAYTRPAADGATEIVVQTPGGPPQVVGRRWSAAYAYPPALDDRRIAWPASRCDLGDRIVVADLGDAPVDPGPAKCSLTVVRRAHVTRAGRLTLDVTCAVGCAADLQVTLKRRRGGGHASVVLPPGRHVVQVPLNAAARRALRRARQLPGRVTWAAEAINRPVTLLAR